MRTSRTPIALLAAAALLLGACASDDDGGGDAAPTTAGPAESTTTTTPPGSAGCGAEEVPEAGTSDLTMTSGGEERRYLLTIPEGYDGTEPMPIVLGLHALTVDYHVIPGMSGFGDKAAEYDFIGVAPSGLIDEDDGVTPYWMPAPVADNYDVAFIGELLDELEGELCVDTTRVFSTGMSNGAQMSSTLACQMSDRITAIAPVSGVEFLEPCEGDPVPVLAFHGVKDPVLPYEGGGLSATTISNMHSWKGEIPEGMPEQLGVDEGMALWAEHNGCEEDFVEDEPAEDIRRRTWQGCDAATVLYIMDEGGHTWPGKPMPQFERMMGPGTTAIDATNLMFSFFFEGELPEDGTGVVAGTAPSDDTVPATTETTDTTETTVAG